MREWKILGLVGFSVTAAMCFAEEDSRVPPGQFFQASRTNNTYYVTDQGVHRALVPSPQRSLPVASRGTVQALPDPDGTKLNALWESQGKGTWVSLATSEEYEQLKPEPPPPPPPVRRNPDPLVLNLIGKPMKFAGPSQLIMFDLDADGTKEFTGWPIGTYDALLVIDRNGNRQIDNGSELFGMTERNPNDANGFEVLKRSDSIPDGVINSYDADWTKLRLWHDAAPYGTVQENELAKLEDYGILQFDLNYKSDTQSHDSHGNLMREYSTFTRKMPNGEVADLPIINVWFRAHKVP